MSLRIMSSQDLILLLNSEKLQIIDVRDFDVFVGFIPGSRHIPSAMFDDTVSELAAEFASLPKILVFYCLGPSSIRAESCANSLAGALQDIAPSHICKICILQGGFEAWRRHTTNLSDPHKYISKDFDFDRYMEDNPSFQRASVNKRSAAPADSGGDEDSDIAQPARTEICISELSASASSVKRVSSTAHSPRALSIAEVDHRNNENGPPSSSKANLDWHRDSSITTARHTRSGKSGVLNCLNAADSELTANLENFRHAQPGNAASGLSGSSTSKVDLHHVSRHVRFASDSGSESAEVQPTPQNLICTRRTSSSESHTPTDELGSSNAAKDLSSAPTVERKTDWSSDDLPTTPLPFPGGLEAWRMRLSVGSEVKIRSSRSKEWYNGVITCISPQMVMVQYFHKGGCCLKKLFLGSSDLAPREEDTSPGVLEEHRGAARAMACASASIGEPSHTGTLSCSTESHASSDTDQLSSKKRGTGLKGSSSTSPLRKKKKDCRGYHSAESQDNSRSKAVDDSKIQYVEASELALSFDDADMVIVDVRGVEFSLGHIPGALHVPHSTFSRKVRELASAHASTRKTLVFHGMDSEFCGPSCARQFLSHLYDHFPDATCQVRVLSGGYKAWERCFVGSIVADLYIAKGSGCLFAIPEAVTEVPLLSAHRTYESLPRMSVSSPTAKESLNAHSES